MSKIPAEILDKIRANDQSLKSLDLKGKGLTVEDIRLLVDALQSNSYLTELNLSVNELGDDSAALLATTRMHRLDLVNNSITAVGAKALANNTHISILNLANNEVLDEGAIALATNLHLRKLVLNSNGIGPKGAQALAKNNNLTHLFLNDNSIKDEGVIALAGHQYLIVFGLGNTRMGDEGAKALVSNKNIVGIQLYQNRVSEDIMSQLVQSVTLNQKNMRAKDLGFIREAIMVIRGSRPGSSSFSTLPIDLLLVILSYVGGNINRNPERVLRVCEFLLETLRKPGELEWQTKKGDTVFFKQWKKAELDEIEDHLKQLEAKTEDQKVYKK